MSSSSDERSEQKVRTTERIDLLLEKIDVVLKEYMQGRPNGNGG